jgi:hypothetical protein
MIIPPRSIVVATAVNTSVETSSQESSTVTTVSQYAGQNGNILVTGSAPIAVGGYGIAYYDLFIFVAIDPNVALPAVGEEWGPAVGQWYVTRGGNGFFSHGMDSANGQPGRAMFYRQSSGSTSEGGGSGGTGCGCCSCYACITAAQASISSSTCSAAPNGAAYQYQIQWGPNAFSDSGGTSAYTTFTWSSSCSWLSASVSITAPSSSSSSSGTGTYQLRMDFSLNSDGFTVAKVYIVFVSGTDWMGAGS